MKRCAASWSIPHRRARFNASTDPVFLSRAQGFGPILWPHLLAQRHDACAEGKRSIKIIGKHCDPSK